MASVDITRSCTDNIIVDHNTLDRSHGIYHHMRRLGVAHFNLIYVIFFYRYRHGLINGNLTKSAMAVAQSKVGTMIKALSGLEDDIDALDVSVADMKRQLLISTQKEIDALFEKTRDMANAEAESIIDTARTRAEADAKKITEEATSRLKDIQKDIDTNFDDAVKDVVATILKP